MQEINQTIMQATYTEYLRLISYLFDYASAFLSTNLGEDYKMPIPVRQVAKKCGLIVREVSLRNRNTMERDSYGGFAKFAETTLRIKKSDIHIGEIRGMINIDCNLPEYAKRFYIAHELARYILTDKNEVYPLKYLPIARGEFSLCESTSELLANTLAYAILMPYEQVIRVKTEYEELHSNAPINYSDWILYLENLVQIPSHCVTLGYEEIRKIPLVKS